MSLFGSRKHLRRATDSRGCPEALVGGLETHKGKSTWDNRRIRCKRKVKLRRVAKVGKTAEVEAKTQVKVGRRKQVAAPKS